MIYLNVCPIFMSKSWKHLKLTSNQRFPFLCERSPFVLYCLTQFILRKRTLGRLPGASTTYLAITYVLLFKIRSWIYLFQTTWFIFNGTGKNEDNKVISIYYLIQKADLLPFLIH